MFLQGTDGFEKDPGEAYHRASVAMALGGCGEAASLLLGVWHQFPCAG